MRYAEKRCRKFKSGRIPFSPEASLWIKKTQVYRSLLKYHAGKIRNRGNLKRSACRCGIENALSIPPKVLYERIKVCVEQCDYFRKHGKSHRRKHLNDRLQVARDKEDDEAEKQILAIITREKEKSKWNRIKYVLGKQRAGACFKVQIEHNKQQRHDHRSLLPRGGPTSDMGQRPLKTFLSCRGGSNL